jgi:hypothetical protein
MTINQSFKLLKNIESNYFIYLQDDLELCDNFFEKIIDLYNNLNDENKISLEFLTDSRTARPNWSMFNPHLFDLNYIKTQWVELHFICEKKFFDVLDFTIFPISDERWKVNPNLSSGVGQQMTNRLLNLKFNMYHIKETLVYHQDHDSLMNYDERKINKLITN